VSETGTLTIRLPREYLDRLDALAQSTNRSKSALASEALAAYLEAQQWQTEAILEAVEMADAGAVPVEGELPRPQ
jgi:RHH-type rel operon transcriptional repressor/antitoxin RelB